MLEYRIWKKTFVLRGDKRGVIMAQDGEVREDGRKVVRKERERERKATKAST